MWSRRHVLALGGLAALSRIAHAKDTTKPMSDLILRTIPSTGEKVPAIGIGSWKTFDVDDVAPITPVLERFLALGGRVIDSSPMYGKAEGAIGNMMAALRELGCTSWDSCS